MASKIIQLQDEQGNNLLPISSGIVGNIDYSMTDAEFNELMVLLGG